MEIWFNPTCSKCRGTLELIQERGVEPTVVRYLDEPPTAERIRDVLTLLGIGARELVRTGEDAYKGLESATDNELIEAMVRHPVLIERPVVIDGARAVIGRPPAKVLDLLNQPRR